MTHSYSVPRSLPRLSRLLCIVSSILSMLVTISARAQEVKSPDGAITVNVILEAGQPSYGITYDGFTVLESSPLGFETSIGSFATGLTGIGTEYATIDEQYTLPHGKVSEVQYVANEMTVGFVNSEHDSLQIIFRVSDRDVALSYRIASQNKFRITIERELTGFDFPQTATAFVTQQALAGTGFAASKPSYEEAYLVDLPIDTKPRSGLGYTFPALFRLGDNGWALVSETGVTSKYCGSRLSNPTAEGLYTITFPEPGENGGLGETAVFGALPLETPWRTITIGETLAPIIETTVATDVVRPLYEPTVEYAPGRATWSWILWQDPSMNEADQRTYIDLAAEMGYEYILIDAFWDANIGREKIAAMVADAREKNVGVFLWYNSNGYWNDAPQTPRNFMDSAPVRRNEMAWLQSIGVKGLKVDFFGGDKQTTMKVYEDIMTDANDYGLMLNFHGATLPRGWERMYPNHMTSEAVTASENLIFSQGFCNSEAFNSTVFTFVRNPVAAMDYGPVLLNKVLSRDQRRGSQRRTTDTFQLATAILFQSPIQHYGLTPNNLEEQPDYVIDFLKKVPAVWDETRYVDGYPGKSVVLARRSGDTWYVAATHAGEEPAEMTVSLPFLRGASMNLIYDNDDGSAGTKNVTVGRDGSVTLWLGTGGGAVLVSSPE